MLVEASYAARKTHLLQQDLRLLSVDSYGFASGKLDEIGRMSGAAGWVLKRAVIRALIWLRLDRLGGNIGWRAAFGKGNVRAALYNLVGSIAMMIIVLLFLDNALDIWGLTVRSTPRL